MVQNSQSLDQKINAKERHIIQERKHTVQNQITINFDGIIIYKSKHPALSEQLL